jgi:hypothetical protein
MKIIALIIGIIMGIIYYVIMEHTLPKNINCTFNNYYIDIFAFICGILLLYMGYNLYNDYILICFGTGLIVEHILQFI